MKIILAPQYPTPGRYQSEWHKLWENALKRSGSLVYNLHHVCKDRVPVIPGNKDEWIAPMKEALMWDSCMIEETERIINRDVDVILSLDFSYPGLYQQYMLYAKRRYEVYIDFYVHATALFKDDWFSRKGWEFKKVQESLLASEADALLFPTYTSLIKFKKYVPISDRKTHVVGFVLDLNRYHYERKVDAVMINGNPEYLDLNLLDKVVDILKKEGVLMWSSSSELTKRYNLKNVDYMEGLRLAKIMFQPKTHETFGVAVAEAVLMDTIPVLPSIDVYNELYQAFTYNLNSTPMEVASFIINCMKSRMVALTALSRCKEHLIYRYLRAPYLYNEWVLRSRRR